MNLTHKVQLASAHFWNSLFRLSLVISGSNLSRFWRRYRFFWGKRALSFYGKCGNDVNFCKHIHIASDLIIGDRSGIGEGALIERFVRIGSDVMMGPDCKIYTSNHEYSDTETPMILQGMRPAEPVVIGDDVWIGANVIILPGVRIGDGCVIGAGSVVTSDTPPYSVSAGNPCRVIKSR